LTGAVEASYDLERLLLHDVVIAPDEQRLLAVATLEQSVDGLKPSKARREKRIIVFNMASREIENQVPVLHEVRDVTLSARGLLALVSYEHNAPPQLFRVDMVNGRARLSLNHTYIPPKIVDFAGPSYFGHFTTSNVHDHLVMACGKGGEVYIWDRDTARLLHSLRAQDQGSDLTGIAWNHSGQGQLMLASASHDGTIRIWTAPLPDNPPNNHDDQIHTHDHHHRHSLPRPLPPAHHPLPDFDRMAATIVDSPGEMTNADVFRSKFGS